MRYVKVFLLACLIFLLLVFFFQNQTVLSQKLAVGLNLFFIPAMKSMELPFYFLLICSFFIGVLMSLVFLVWDKVHQSARIIKNNWYIKVLERELDKANKMAGRETSPKFFEKLWRQHNSIEDKNASEQKISLPEKTVVEAEVASTPVNLSKQQ